MIHKPFFTAQKLQRNVHIIPQSLGLSHIPIHIGGHSFYCVANFTLRKLLTEWCQWSKRYPAQKPDSKTIQNWCQIANRPYLIQEHNQKITTETRNIHIPSIPSEINHRTSLAYMGGLLHESAHLLYTHQKDLKPSQVQYLVEKYWNRMPTWALFENALLKINNLLEDIRIERLLRSNFLNMLVPLSDLQDLILDWEGINDPQKWADSSSKSSVLLACFRDLGLGYETDLGEKALSLYKEHYPLIWEEIHHGTLKALLKKSIEIEDSFDHFELTLEMMIAIKDLMMHSKSPQPSASQTPEYKNVKAHAHRPDQSQGSDQDGKRAHDENHSNHPDPSTIPASENGPVQRMPNSQHAETTDHQSIQQFWSKLGIELIRNPHPHRCEQVQSIAQYENIRSLMELPKNEKRWHPMTTTADKIVPVSKISNHQKYNQLLNENKHIIYQLQTPLRRLLLGLECTYMIHGSPHGKSLSSRKYASTWAAIQQGKKPQNPYQRKSDHLQLSLSASIIIDQSSSMSPNTKELINGVMVLATALHNIHARMEILGFNTSHFTNNVDALPSGSQFHRNYPVTIFKYLEYGQSFIPNKDKLLMIHADGSTPTSDAIQIALSNIAKEKSTHRFIIILTDGHPNQGHQEVINRQIRLAKEFGIYLIGVGLGKGTANVVQQFPYAIYCPKIETLAPELLKCITEILKEHPSQIRR